MIKLKVYSVPIRDVSTTKDGHLVVAKNKKRRLLAITDGMDMEKFIAKIKEEYCTTVSPDEIKFIEDVEVEPYDEDPYVAGHDKYGRCWLTFDFDRTDWECKDCIWDRWPSDDLKK